MQVSPWAHGYLLPILQRPGGLPGEAAVLPTTTLPCWSTFSHFSCFLGSPLCPEDAPQETLYVVS